MTYIPELTYETYIPDPTVWTDTGINHPSPLYTSIIRVGSTLYSFGGYTGSVFHNKIYSAPWNDSTNWTDTLATVPYTPFQARAAIIDGYIYLFGDNNNLADIYRASVLDPLSWVDTGANIATARMHAGCVCVVDTKIIINHGTGYASFDTANISSPTVWTSFDPPGGGGIWEHNNAVIDNRLLMFGGFNSFSRIRELNSYLTYENVTRLYILPELCDKAPEIYHIGNSIWIIGGTNHTYVHEVPISAPMQQVSSYNCLPATVPYVQGSSWIDPNGYLYILSAANTSGPLAGRIYRSGRTKVYSEMPPTDGSSRPLLARTEKGEWTVVTKTCRLGFKSWLTNRTDLIP